MKTKSLFHSLLCLLCLFVAKPALAQTNAPDTSAPPQAAQPSVLNGGFDLLKTVYNAMPSNLCVGPYGTYVVNPKKLGWGVFAAYNINDYVAPFVALDHVDSFVGFSGGLQFQLKTHPIPSWTNFVVTPFAGTGLGTPLGGAGGDNGGLQTALFGGSSFEFGRWLGGRFAVSAAGGTRSGAGAYGGPYINAFVGWKKDF